MSDQDTICAIATAPGRGGVGIVRVSGPDASRIAKLCTKRELKTRYATHCDFYSNNSVIDQGIAIFFQNPHSFTGEDVFEFQGHGGPVLLDMVVERCLQLGARLARPGEFSERAFLNDKLDLTQAEAIADLIDASSRQAAQQAMNSLKGAFAKEIDYLVEQLTHLRIYVESAIDFPEEEIDFLSDGIVESKMNDLLKHFAVVQEKAKQGSTLREGMKVVLAGKPNAGKSTLLNALAEKEVAIVTDIAGTTRDTLTEHIHINGMPLHLTDTAGIRETDNEVEQIGIQRAWKAIEEADRILLLIDSNTWSEQEIHEQWPDFFANSELKNKLSLVFNKVDLCTQAPKSSDQVPSFQLSAKQGSGLEELRQHLLDTMGLSSTTEGGFSARRRHLDALQRAYELCEAGMLQLKTLCAGELLAEDLRQAQEALGEITGRLSPDALLGKIFSSFCIGK
ncbi:tRNA uridine-5-carboxymethylaminomethyl(34) synthesis GTPase MnmE [Agaribacterium sp. ZY112]|uniref:tRNA uridine-5-carboxymethylaminomethyl(34) synthesis GTPase MnmE n=1 Tax=Agaribacterium sp. ZY112 TaxID=3233574 RepID=UPI003523F63B